MTGFLNLLVHALLALGNIFSSVESWSRHILRILAVNLEATAIYYFHGLSRFAKRSLIANSLVNQV